MDIYCHEAIRGALVVAFDRDDVGVIAASGDFDVMIVRSAVVRGIEAAPAKVGDIHFAPRMRSLRADKFVEWPVIEIAADVTRRNVDGATHPEHEMSKILTDAAFKSEDFEHVRGDGGALRCVFEVGVDEATDCHGSAPDILVAIRSIESKLPNFRRKPHEGAGLKKVIAFFHAQALRQANHGRSVGIVWQRRRGGVNARNAFDGERFVRFGDCNRVDGVEVEIQDVGEARGGGEFPTN